MSIQSNFPAAKPSLLLDFANTKQLDPRITFTRASTANYYDGKTATKAEQNLFTYSEQFDNAAWSKQSGATITANATTAPDGNSTASLLYPSTTASGSYVIQAPSSTGGNAAVLSVYAKAQNKNVIWLYHNTGAEYGLYYVNLSNGTYQTTNGSTATGTLAFTYVGNGWYRITVSFASTYNGSANWGIGVADVVGSINVTTSGTSGIYIWGAQVEQRSTVSAYTATTSVPITNYIPTLQSAASGVARFDSNPTTGESLGLLIEESRTNLATASAQFETPDWLISSGSKISSNAVVAPDGTLVGDLFTTTSSGQLIYRSATLTATAYTFSLYAKVGSLSSIRLDLVTGGFAKGSTCVFDLSAGTTGTVTNYGTTTGSTAAISSVGNGWYRCSLTVTATAETYYPEIAPNSVGTIYLWGAQLEAGSSATSYVATPLTFTSRASSATYLGPNGYITSATTNTARNQTNSVGTTNLLLESAASNTVTYTDDLANAVWTKSNVTLAINSTQSPDGLTFADKICENSATGYHYVDRSGLPSANVTQTFSFYAKAAERDRLWIQIGSDQIYFDLSSGTVFSGTGVITAVGGGWYRCSATSTFSITTLQFGLYTSSSNYAGTSGYGAYLWGFQLETGSTATSYIPSVETWSSRSSAAKYYNSSGVLTSASSGVARTTYNPALLGAGGKLLLEPAATNLLLYSQAFNNAAWNLFNGTVTANTVVAPDGATTGCTWTVSGTAGSAVYRGSLTFTTGTVYTTSCYLKAGTNSYAYVNAQGGGTTYATGVFNLASGSVGQTAVAGSGVVVTSNIESVGSGWYRCSITYVANSAMTIIAIGAAPAATGNSFDSNGNPTGNVNGATLYTWGAQWETGSGATSYITTTSSTVTRAADASSSAAQSRSADVYSASTVTRAADAASMTGTNFSSWYRQDEGTMFADATMSPTANGRVVQIGISGFSYLSMIGIVSNSTATSVQASLINLPGGDAFDFATTTYARGTAFKGAVAYKNGSIAATFNGATPATSSSTTAIYTSMTTIGIGQGDSGSYLNGTIKKLAYYPNRLTNANIQAITT